MRLRTLLTTLLCLTMASTAAAQRDKLSVGDPAPGLDIEEWVRGEEVTIRKGTVYLIVFWDTGTGSILRGYEQLNVMFELFTDRGLEVMGICTDEKETVEPWLNRNGRDITFPVAIDRRKGSQRAWVDAAGFDEDDQPLLFVVDQRSKVVWMGSPGDKEEATELALIMDKVVRGRYDPVLEAEAAPLLAAARDARKTRTFRIALKQYDNVIEMDERIFADVALERFEMMVADMKEPADAYAYARTGLLSGIFADDAEALAMLAEKIATDPAIDDDDRDLDLALECAEAARKMNDMPHTNASLALVHFHRGEIEEAIRLQKKAWLRARPGAKPELKRVLRAYQAAGHRSGLDR